MAALGHHRSPALGILAARTVSIAASGANGEIDGPTGWLELDDVAETIITARGERLDRAGGFWSAECPGEQSIEVRFHRPTAVRRIRLVSVESELSRTQELVVWASLKRGEQHVEVVRQRCRFIPREVTQHVQEYAVHLDEVSRLRVRIVPATDGYPAVARLSDLRVAAVV